MVSQQGTGRAYGAAPCSGNLEKRSCYEYNNCRGIFEPANQRGEPKVEWIIIYIYIYYNPLPAQAIKLRELLRWEKYYFILKDLFLPYFTNKKNNIYIFFSKWWGHSYKKIYIYIYFC